MRVAANFSTGHELLESYWGFLSGGGLFLPNQPELKEGDEVHLDVAMRGRHYALRARMVQRSAARSGEVMALAFTRGGLHASMLADAWSDAHGAAPRTFHRLAPQQAARVSVLSGKEATIAFVLDISYGGLCLFSDVEDAYPVDHPVMIDAGEGLVPARVRWVDGHRIGLEFEHVTRDSWKVTTRLMTLCVVQPLNSRE